MKYLVLFLLLALVSCGEDTNYPVPLAQPPSGSENCFVSILNETDEKLILKDMSGGQWFEVYPRSSMSWTSERCEERYKRAQLKEAP